MNDETPMPVSRFPGDLSVRRWLDREDRAAVVVRCDRGKRRCDRLVFIYESPQGSVVHFFSHSPDQPATFNGNLPEDWEPAATYKHFNREDGTAMLRGRVDDAGAVVSLEDDDYWSDVVIVGCRHHLGTVHCTRQGLMQALRDARRRGRPVELGLAEVATRDLGGTTL